MQKYIFEIMILENITEMNKRRVWSSNCIWWMESVWMTCMGVCINYSSFEYESPQLSSVALNAVHTLYLGILFFFVTQIWMHITVSELLFQSGDYEAFFLMLVMIQNHLWFW